MASAVSFTSGKQLFLITGGGGGGGKDCNPTCGTVTGQTVYFDPSLPSGSRWITSGLSLLVVARFVMPGTIASDDYIYDVVGSG
jgi:hypothetical protein